MALESNQFSMIDHINHELVFGDTLRVKHLFYNPYYKIYDDSDWLKAGSPYDASVRLEIHFHGQSV